MKTRQVTLLSMLTILAACAQKPVQHDPLQNTKKLASEGHATLYNNGAFEIPMTTIHIIPPAPDTIEFASELAGMHARQSFQESIKHARESVGITQSGVEKSEQAALAIHESTADVAGSARELTYLGTDLAGSSPRMVREMVGASVDYSGKAYTMTSQAGEELAEGSLTAGGNISDGTLELAQDIWGGTRSIAASTSDASRAAAGRHAAFAAERFVKGYAAVPEKFGQRIDAVSESTSLVNFVDAYKSSNEWRSEQSGKMADIVVETATNYTHDVGESFSAAKREIDNSNETGYTFALLKSLRWVVQGIFWDATIKPVGKMAGGSLGYVTVNTVAFPALVTVKEGVAVANVAVQVTWNSAAGVYDVTAPTATAALAGLFSAAELVGGQALAGGELLVGSTATAGAYVAGQTTAAATAGGGYLTGKTVQYVGAPLSTIGVAAGGSALGKV